MNKIKVIFLVFLVAIGLTIFGCQAKAEDPYHKVSLDGSTSMEKLMNALKEAIREDYPELSLEPQFTGSGSGIKAVASGKVDIGNSSRALTDEEKAQGIERKCSCIRWELQ